MTNEDDGRRKKLPLHKWHEEHGARWSSTGALQLPQSYGNLESEALDSPESCKLVDRSDLGRLELRDRLLVELGGFHGLLPRVNVIQRLVTRHLKPDYRGTVWGRRLPGVRQWKPPIEDLPERPY